MKRGGLAPLAIAGVIYACLCTQTYLYPFLLALVLLPFLAKRIPALYSGPPYPVATGEDRRRAFNATVHHPPLPEGVQHREQYLVVPHPPKGSCLIYTNRYLPVGGNPKACILFLHGYSDHSNWGMRDTALRFVKEGFAVYQIDFEGHGLSDGLHSYVPSLDRLAEHAAMLAKQARQEFPEKRLFTLAQSMGGAVALYVSRRFPGLLDGALLSAPMCKVSDKMRPPEIVTKLLMGVARLFPRLPITPTPDLGPRCFKLPERFERALQNPLRYGMKPRLGTAAELVRVSDDLEGSLSEVEIPFLVMHGDADTVTDPDISKALYERAKSKDKTLHLVPGAYHALFDEPPEISDPLFTTMVEWMEKRSA